MAEEEEIKEFMELAAGATNYKTFFDSLTAVGFTENQALKFMAYILWTNTSEGTM